MVAPSTRDMMDAYVLTASMCGCEPHGAATLLRVSKSALSQLRISWAVFLPISEASDISIPPDGNTLGQFRLLLHGYFFLDSGRRQIEG
jgi:hypothetical protein